ncbi:kelch-like protein 30 isoform X2 [Syngnathus scovelli]|uniref:kelch-like protein 30 isoform X2 n=2 Tax=Syngnathus scovelli TaxID=161590 RepID=UPI0021105B09|nr:kelch-like protein 30 isoform X2 [Syngnathus scovelli]
MVRNVDDLDFCLPSHPQTILDGLRTLCSQPKMVDVTLSAGGRDFPCHRGVLALCSGFFSSMFSGDFTESIAARVELQEVDPEILGCLLDFAYTGKLTINQSNVEGLIRTSSRLQFQTVRAVCTRYLQHQIDATNCLGILEFGEIHGCPEVVAKARAFLLENFEAVQLSEEFLLQEKDRLVSCLSHDGLQIRCEHARVEAVLRWVGHRREARLDHMPELLGLCRLELLDPDYLKGTLLQDALVQASDGCREAVEKVHIEKMHLAPKCMTHVDGQSPQPNLQEVLFVMGGRSLDDDSDDDSDDEDGERARARERRAPLKNCAFYNTKTKQWHELPNFPNPNKWGFSMVSLNNDVYVTGGSRGSNTNTWSTTETWKYITKEGRWVTVAPMLRPRTNHSSATLNGEIYVIGGTTLARVEVERYDPYHDTWTSTCPAVKYMTNFTCTACQGKLYVIGSCAVKYNALTMQCYNPVIDSWMNICSPFIPKYLSSPRSVCMEGNIYLLADNTKKVYSYDPDANLWQKIQLLHMLHENGGLVSLDGRLYVTGGHWKGMEGDYGVEVEVYNRASDTWEVEGFLPRLWFFSGVSTIFLDPTNWPRVFPADTT